MKRLSLIKKVEGIRFVNSFFETNIIDGKKEMLIVTDKKTGLQDVYEVFYIYSQRESRFLSTVCENKTNKEVIKILQEELGMVV